MVKPRIKADPVLSWTRECGERVTIYSVYHGDRQVMGSAGDSVRKCWHWYQRMLEDRPIKLRGKD